MSTLPCRIAYIGCYSDQRGGIHILHINPNNGEMKRVGIAAAIADPTWVEVNRACTKLYAGVASVQGHASQGGVAAFDIHGDSLSFSSHQPSGGAKPCHVLLDQDEKAAFAANYSEGTGSYFRLDAAGEVQPESLHFVHQGKGPHPTRQSSAHVHYAQLTPDQRILYLVDLGLDRIFAYNYDNGRGDLARMPEADILAEPGAGPRHLLFTRNGDIAYVINELGSSVAVYRRDGQAYRQLQLLSTLPQGYTKASSNTASAIKLSADGTRLLCSNRGYDSIAVYAVNQDSGLLELMCINPTLGRGPRDFAIMPGDQFVLVAHQYTDNLVCFRFDRETGAFTPVGHQLLVPQGVCIQFGAEVSY